MKVSSKALVEKCAGNKDVRSYLNEPYLDAEKSRLVATDGHRLVVWPVELDEGDTSGPVSRDALKAARKLDKQTTHVKANGGFQLSDGSTLPRAELQTKYPDYERIIPERGPVAITFNAKYLFEIAQAMGVPNHHGVTLYIDPDNVIGSMRVEPVHREDGNERPFAVLMPMRG